MGQNDNTEKKIPDVYASLLATLSGGRDDERAARQAAMELGSFGKEGADFIARRLKTAGEEELRSLLPVVRHLEHPEIGEGLTEVVVNRVLPLDLKRDYFEVMAELGHAIEGKFLSLLQEADELYLQISAHLRAGEEGVERSRALTEDFLALPAVLQFSFVQELFTDEVPGTGGFLAALAGRDGALDDFLADQLRENEAADGIAALQIIADSSPDKEAARKARKALYVMKEKGVVESGAPAAVETPAVRPATREEARSDEGGEEAFVTPFDSFGTRIVLVAMPTLGGMLVCQGTVDELRGLMRFSAAETPRKRYRDFLKELREQVKNQGLSTLVRIDGEHARWLLQEAYRITQGRGALIPESYKALRYRLKPADGYDPARAGREDELFAILEVAMWMIERDQLLPFTRRYMEQADSPLVLEEHQRRARIHEIAGVFAGEYFDGPRLERMIMRAQETAYLVFQMGRRAEALRLATLAASLPEHRADKPHPFLASFMLRSIIGTLQAFAREEEERRGREEGRIITPR
jgi:hypothetical protein